MFISLDFVIRTDAVALYSCILLYTLKPAYNRTWNLW